jgi:hypothetical protein
LQRRGNSDKKLTGGSTLPVNSTARQDINVSSRNADVLQHAVIHAFKDNAGLALQMPPRDCRKQSSY